ncbi:PrsW family intramembrane metalloprotease [Salinilacihabitans rarus]|uniref:PrsW family intramembrane metalloprotease n=1 Tax=Salinilacihabitans rarus TaxID=2961596 RepID=UPI0020C8E6C8|nr:PrsW family glutamic-type intramembrane protease [Salinilacihabitans rarus]
MKRRRDLVERFADDEADLYDISTWEPRSLLDRFSYGLYAAINYGLHGIVLLVAFVITISLLASPALIVADQPILGVFFALSVVPALLLAAFIWRSDITTSEPLGLLVATFLLAVLFATFAAVVNSVASFRLQAIPVVGSILFFYLVVGPVEEAVKLLAVRVLAYRNASFDAVIDGAVYGAIAGLGFAAIENVIYIAGTIADVEAGFFAAATGITTLRALVGPGHVIYSAIAGYYLGLAKFNPRYAGPLVVKGLLIAAFVHGTYNSTVGVVPSILSGLFPVGPELAFVGYVVAFDAAIGYYLYRKLSRYRRTYRAVRSHEETDPAPELTEFDPARR